MFKRKVKDEVAPEIKNEKIIDTSKSDKKLIGNFTPRIIEKEGDK